MAASIFLAGRKHVIGNGFKRCPTDAPLGIVDVSDLLEDFPRLLFGQMRPDAFYVINVPNRRDAMMFGE